MRERTSVSHAGKADAAADTVVVLFVEDDIQRLVAGMEHAVKGADGGREAGERLFVQFAPQARHLMLQIVAFDIDLLHAVFELIVLLLFLRAQRLFYGEVALQRHLHDHPAPQYEHKQGTHDGEQLSDQREDGALFGIDGNGPTQTNGDDHRCGR